MQNILLFLLNQAQEEKQCSSKPFMKSTLLTAALLISASSAFCQSFTVTDKKVFQPQSKKIVLLENSNNKRLILFKSNLVVNTDGSPTSYHPYDLGGDSIALNSILNAIAVYRKSDGANLSVPDSKMRYTRTQRATMAHEAYGAIKAWRDGGFSPTGVKGYNLIWKNVLVAKYNKLCIFTSGKYKGYFSSATALTNGLTDNQGECNCNNQLNSFDIPALVLAANGPANSNPVRDFGAEVGDLVVAYNPTTKSLVYAIIGDTGPYNNLGEGSIALNMKLKSINEFPNKRSQTDNLSVGSALICIIPNSGTFQVKRPYSQKNIRTRITNWFASQGIHSEHDIVLLFEAKRLEL